MVLSFGLVQYALSSGTVVRIMVARFVRIPVTWTPPQQTVVTVVRLPEILGALLVGAALSSSGTAYQTMLRNPLVSPEILGLAAGAGFGGSLSILLGLPPAELQVTAFAGVGRGYQTNKSALFSAGQASKRKWIMTGKEYLNNAGISPHRSTDPREAFMFWCIDDAVGFGDVYPDLLALLCVQPAVSGGESFLVDGQCLFDAIARDTNERDLAQFLWSVPIEQCARPQDRPPGIPGDVRSRRPIASKTADGRLAVRYNHDHQRVLDEGPVDDQHRAQLARWHHLGQLAAATAPRFRLQPGELLVIDNYRVFHGREPYQGTQRYLHRAQEFTDLSLSRPNAGTHQTQ